MKLPTFNIEQKNASRFGMIVGVDEAGRGPLAGPVVAAAVRYRLGVFKFPIGEEQYTRLVRDSKTLSEKQREIAYTWICERFDVGIGIVDAATIDRLNILRSTLLAMKESVKKIAPEEGNDKGVLVLVDGNREIPGLSVSQEAVVKGDSRSISIAAASIVAKVMRDRMMIAFEKTYPGYGFSRHKGYGTAAHMAALGRLGPCFLHRRSFAPVAKFARNAES